jgi:hypothetical protein
LAPLQYNRLGPENNSKETGKLRETNTHFRRRADVSVALGLREFGIRQSARRQPQGPQVLYVVQETGDDHAIDKLISANLKSKGYSATCGEAAQPR